jgi:hypothetical protein
MKILIAIILVLVLALSAVACGEASERSYSDISMADLYGTSAGINTNTPFKDSGSSDSGISAPGRLDISADHSVFPIENVSVGIYFGFDTVADNLPSFDSYTLEFISSVSVKTERDHSGDGREEFLYEVTADGSRKYSHSEQVIIPKECFAEKYGKIGISASINSEDDSRSAGNTLYYRTDGKSVQLSVESMPYEVFAEGSVSIDEMMSKYSPQEESKQIPVGTIRCFDGVAYSIEHPLGVIENDYVLATVSDGSTEKKMIDFYHIDSTGEGYKEVEAILTFRMSIAYNGEVSIVSERGAVTVYLWDDGIALRFACGEYNTVVGEVKLISAARIRCVRENDAKRDEMLDAALSKKESFGFTLEPKKGIIGYTGISITMPSGKEITVG